MKLNRIKTT